jgi:hypothetical protein
MTASTTASAPTHMGTPPPGYHQEWVTHTVHVHGFENLPAVRRVASPEFILLGNEWLLRIYPGGDDDAAEGMVTVGLQNMSNKAIDIDLGFSVNDGNGMQVAYGQSDGPRNFAPLGGGTNRWKFNVAERSTLLSSLVDGTLVIEIQMRLANHTKPVPPPFIPENPLTKMIQEEFLEEKYSDIVFEVGGGSEKGQCYKGSQDYTSYFSSSPYHRSKILEHTC